MDLSKEIPWSKVFGIIEATRNMKRNQLLPLRTEIVERQISKLSEEKLRYVGDYAQGMDFIDPNGVRYECKLKGTVFPKRKSTKFTYPIIGKNYYGNCLGAPEKTFEKIILIDTKSSTVGTADWEECQWRIKSANAEIRVPVEKVNIIASSVIADPSLSALDFEEIIFKAIDAAVGKEENE